MFTTGSDRVPVGGMGEMTFKITKMTQKLKNGESKQKLVNLPEAHTCFNQLVLPGMIMISFNISLTFASKVWNSFKKSCNIAEQYLLNWLLHATKMQKVVFPLQNGNFL